MMRQLLRTSRIAAIAILFSVLTASATFAESWPSTKFEVFEGVPGDEQKTASVPLTPELKYEIEEYLGAVASEYQKYFPVPRLEPLVKRDDGVQAYRIYYYDIPGNAPALARYGNDCPDSTFFRIEVNAASLTQGGKITARGYGNLAHELFHAVQRGSTLGRKLCDPDTASAWIIEGQAEAIGHDMARTLRAVEDDTQVSRWGLRYYSVPLVIEPGGPRSRGYQTSSFWRYIAEMHYLKGQGKRDADAKPGPDLSNSYATDYSYLANLMNSAPGTGQKAETKWFNDWLLSYFGVDLSRTFTDFVGVFAQYGKYRIDGSKVPGSDADFYWREISFGASNDLSERGCRTLRLDEKNDHASVNLSLDKLSASCIELDVGDTGTPLAWTLQTIGKDKASLKQLRLAMAGGQQVATSAPLDDVPLSSGAVAKWHLLLDPNKKQYLLVTNIAKNAQNTVPQDIMLLVTLSGRDDDQLPAQNKPVPGKDLTQKAKPGPAGASQTRARRKAEMGAPHRGAGGASWDREEAYSGCSGKRSSPDCQPKTTIKLRSGMVEQMLPGTSTAAALGGLPGQMMEMATVDMAAVMTILETGESDSGSEVTIKIPGIDYGFTGTLRNAVILVSGANESTLLRSMSPSPEDSRPPCLYRKPTGTVTIEEFTPFIMRGSYSGQLVEGGVVRNVRKCPTKSVVDSISGRFVIAAPWSQDRRREIDTSWLLEDSYNDINQMMPAGFKVTDPGGPGGPPIIEMNGTEITEQDADEFDLGECDCSCESIRKGMKVAQGGMTGSQPGAEGFQLMMCMGQCMAKIPEDCELD